MHPFKYEYQINNETRKPLLKPDWQIIVNGQVCECIKSTAVQVSSLIKKSSFVEGNNVISNFVTDIPDLKQEDLMLAISYISKILSGDNIFGYENNVEMLAIIGKHFEIEDLNKNIEKFRTYIEEITFYLNNDSDLNLMKEFEKLLLLHRSEDNLDIFINSILPFSSKIPPSCLIHFILAVFLNNFKNNLRNQISLVIEVMKRLEKYLPGIIPLFLEITFKKFFWLNNEDSDTMQQEEINSLVSQIFIEKMDDFLKNEIKIDRNLTNIPTCLGKCFEKDSKSIKIVRSDKRHFDKKEENNKPYEKILLFLQKDELDSFQKCIAAQEIDINFLLKNDLNIIKTEIKNKQNCSLIEYSAFFGSINCFKFLYKSQAHINKESLGDYAIAGGNTEIIHICQHENCIFDKKALFISIKFHHHKLTKWLVETKRVPINELHFRSSIIYYNICSMIYFIKKGMDLSKILLYSCMCNNSILFKRILFSKIESLSRKLAQKNINQMALLPIACEQNNVEIVKLLLTKENLDINADYNVY